MGKEKDEGNASICIELFGRQGQLSCTEENGRGRSCTGMPGYLFTACRQVAHARSEDFDPGTVCGIAR